MSENRRIHLRVGTTAEWTTNNPILAEGEPGYEVDSEILRIGDGVTAFLSLTGLPFSVALAAGLASIGALTTAANQMLYTTASNTYATTALTAAARALLDDADATAMRTTLGLAINTNVQAYDADLAAIAALVGVRGDLIRRGVAAWERLALGTTGQKLVSNGTDVVWGAADVLTKKFVSGEQVITSGGLLTLAHGMGVAPLLTQYRLVCKVEGDGYLVGDQPVANLNSSTSAGTRWSAEYADATNLYIRFSGASDVFAVVNKTGGGVANVSNANWRLIAAAFA